MAKEVSGMDQSVFEAVALFARQGFSIPQISLRTGLSAGEMRRAGIIGKRGVDDNSSRERRKGFIPQSRK